MTSTGFTVERSVLICAQRATVFRFFTDSKRFADWWGKGSSIEPRVGGAVKIVYPGGQVTVSGIVLEIVENERVVFTYGYDDPAKPIPPGGSRVVVTLASHEQGTRVTLVHEVADAKTRDEHAPGWRFQLSLFANVVAKEQHAAVAARIDRWYEAWNTADAAASAAILAETVTSDVTFQDSFAYIAGAAELAAHITAIHLHMPMTLERDGDPKQCQGTALSAWVAKAKDGAVKGRGTNIYTLAPDGRIAKAVGFWES